MKFLSGPIERARDMLPQLKSGKPVAYPSIVYGMKLIVVGLIKKLILADYISPYIDGIFNSIHTASGIQLLMACLLYPVELYGDFLVIRILHFEVPVCWDSNSALTSTAHS